MYNWFLNTWAITVAHARMEACVDLCCGIAVAMLLVVGGLVGWLYAKKMDDDILAPMICGISVVAFIFSALIVVICASECIPTIVDPAGAVARGLLR